MFTHHEMMLMQAAERELQVELQARRDGPVAALRRAMRARARRESRRAVRPAVSRTRRDAVLPRPAGTLASCAASGGPAR